MGKKKLNNKCRFHRVSDNIWEDEKFSKWDQDTKLLCLYLQTCKHRTTEGIFRLPKNYMIEDLNWKKPKFEKAFKKLIEENFIKYDEKVSVVLIINAFKYNDPGDNENQIKGLINQIIKLPKTYLLKKFTEEVKTFNDKLYDELLNHIEDEGSSDGVQRTLEVTRTNTITKTNNNNNKQQNLEEKEREIKKTEEFLLQKGVKEEAARNLAKNHSLEEVKEIYEE